MSSLGVIGGRLSSAERDRIRAYMRDPEQMAFFHVVPSETGLGRTIWVSQNEAYPAVLVAANPGRQVHPPDNALIVGFGEKTPFLDLNEWLNRNRDLLAALAAQELDVADFYEGMERVAGAPGEMVNVPRRLTGLPMVVYCSPRMLRMTCG